LTEHGEEWLLVDFDTPEALAEIVSDALWSLGVVAIEEMESSEGRVLLRTSLGVDASAGTAAIVDRFRGVTATPVSVPASVADTWRKFAVPTHVVDDVWIVPQWSPQPIGRCILVEPFDTFGLGNHPTTVLTLRAALSVASSGDLALDLGSGSGVLSVALAKLADCEVDAHDIASQGEHALLHNAGLNGCSSLVRWLPSVDTSSAGHYRLVMANILAPVLRQLSGDIQAVTERGGTIVLSGIREEQVPGVVEHFGECEVVAVDTLEGWAGVTLRRN